MDESISFYLASGERHPEEKVLQQSPLAKQILDSLQKHDEVLGKNRTVAYRLSADGTCGILELRVMDNSWGHFFKAEFSLEGFLTPVLPENFKQAVTIWVNEAAQSVVLTGDVWGAEK